MNLQATRASMQVAYARRFVIFAFPCGVYVCCPRCIRTSSHVRCTLRGLMEPAALAAASSTDNGSWRLLHSGKEPAALLSARKGACRPLLTKEPAALLTATQKEPAALFARRSLPPFFFETRSLPPSRSTDTCLSFASYGACRPCTKKSESLPPRTEEHDDQARGSLPPLAHLHAPLGARRPGFQSASDTFTGPQSKRHGRTHESSTLPAKRTHHARNASSAVFPRPVARSTPATLEQTHCHTSVDVLCVCGSHASGF